MKLVKVEYRISLPYYKHLYVEVPDNFDLEKDGKELTKQIELEDEGLDLFPNERAEPEAEAECIGFASDEEVVNYETDWIFDGEKLK